MPSQSHSHSKWDDIRKDRGNIPDFEDAHCQLHPRVHFRSVLEFELNFEVDSFLRLSNRESKGECDYNERHVDD